MTKTEVSFVVGKAQTQDNRGDAGDGPSNSKSQQKDIFPVRPTRLMEDMWYTSPEEVLDGTCSFASDIYSLGVLFFEVSQKLSRCF